MIRSMRLMVALSIFLTVAECHHEAEAGWGFPNLNPFKSNQMKQPVGPKKDSGWGLPGLPKLPGFGNSNKPKGPAKKSMLTKTKETLFPWTRPKQTEQKLTGAQRTYQPRSQFASESREESHTIFSSWFKPADNETRRPTSPHEWLGNPRP